MTSNVSSDIKKDINRSLWVGIALIVLGIVAIALPVFSTIVVETWFALILASAGTAKVVHAFATREKGGFLWELLLGILYIATGIMLFVYPLTGVLTLTLLLGSFLIMEGTFEIVLAFRLRPQPYWVGELINGIVTLILGGMIWFRWPFDAPSTIGILVGVSVLFSGISRIMLSLNPPASTNQPNQAA